MILLGTVGAVALVVALVGGAVFVMLDIIDARATDLPRAIVLGRQR